MTEFGEYIKKVRDSKGMTLNQVALYSNISAAQLSRIETGKRGVPKPSTIKKLAEALKVNYSDLMGKAGYLKNENNTGLPELTPKDEKDIAKDLKKIINSLENKDGYSHFDGQSIEDMDEEDRELLIASLETSMRIAKQIAKQKFTPKKYRKQD